MDNLRLRTVVATALLLIAGVWTVGARAENVKQLEKKERGWVPIIAFTNTPVVDADIVVSRENGKVIFEKEHATNARGFYPAEIDSIPKKFRVTVLWVPTRAPYRSLGLVRMSADVNDYDRANGQVYVNPVTTIVSRLRDRRPELSLARAQAIVRFVLGMPANASLGAALREGPYFQSPFFSESDFIQKAIAYGGFESYIENLVMQAVYHPEKQTINPPVMQAINPQNEPVMLAGASPVALAAAGSPGKEVAQFVALSLAQGALSYLGGQGVGWAATAAGILEPGVTPADIAKLQASLEDLQSSVDALSNQLAQSTAQILAAINYSQYNTLSIQALQLAAQVNVVEQNVTDLADGCPPATSQPAPPLSTYCKSQKAKVAKQLSESQIDASYEELAAFLEDTATVGNKGMLHLFSLCMGESVGHFFRNPDSVKIRNMWDYWDAVETQAANLKVELLHLQKAQDDPGGQKVLLRFLGDASQNPPTNGELQNTHATENNVVWPLLPTGTVIDNKNHVMWMTSLPGNTTYPACQNALVTPGPPGNGSGIATGPVLKIYLFSWQSNAEGSLLLNWRSPTADEVSSLIDGWKGNANSPNAYIHDQTVGRSSDPPGGVVPFINIVPATGNKCASWGPYVWTQTKTGSTYQGSDTYYMLDMQFGDFADAKSIIGAPGQTNWLFLVHDLTGGEQYYWYN